MGPKKTAVAVHSAAVLLMHTVCFSTMDARVYSHQQHLRPSCSRLQPSKGIRGRDMHKGNTGTSPPPIRQHNDSITHMNGAGHRPINRST